VEETSFILQKNTRKKLIELLENPPMKLKDNEKYRRQMPNPLGGSKYWV
jgi:hypothetical protein